MGAAAAAAALLLFTVCLPQSDDEIRAWIHELGDESPEVRERATQRPAAGFASMKGQGACAPVLRFASCYRTERILENRRDVRSWSWLRVAEFVLHFGSAESSYRNGGLAKRCASP